MLKEKLPFVLKATKFFSHKICSLVSMQSDERFKVSIYLTRKNQTEDKVLKDDWHEVLSQSNNSFKLKY